MQLQREFPSTGFHVGIDRLIAQLDVEIVVNNSYRVRHLFRSLLVMGAGETPVCSLSVQGKENGGFVG